MKATDTFRHPDYKHNCAQAIAYKWSRLFPEQDAIVAKYAPLIGGSAPGGRCGALYAAIQAMPDHAEEIEREFTEIIGARCCCEIKMTAKAPCPLCVDTADRLLEKYNR